MHSTSPCFSKMKCTLSMIVLLCIQVILAFPVMPIQADLGECKFIEKLTILSYDETHNLDTVLVKTKSFMVPNK